MPEAIAEPEPATEQPKHKPRFKPDVDWQLVQTFYSQGISPAQIAAKFPETGLTSLLVRMHAHRGKWKRLVTAVEQVQKQAVTTVLKDEKDAIQKASLEARKGLSAETLEQISHLSTKVRRGKAIENVQSRAQVLRTLAEAAKTVYGWDADSGKSTVINFAVLDHIPEQPKQVIDVSPSVEPSTDQA